MKGIVAALFYLACLCSEPSAAQEVTFTLSNASTPVETYAAPHENNVKVSGKVLAGVRIGDGSQPFRIDRLAIARPGGVDEVCLRIVTVDGRYWSLNAFVAGAKDGSVGVVQIASKYSSVLRGYQTADVAVRATVGHGCTELTEGAVLPTLGAQAAGPRSLTLLVNAEARPAAVKRSSSKAWLPCKPIVDRTAVAFTHECTVALEGADHQLALDVGTIGFTGSIESKSYTISLPPP